VLRRKETYRQGLTQNTKEGAFHPWITGEGLSYYRRPESQERRQGTHGSKDRHSTRKSGRASTGPNGMANKLRSTPCHASHPERLTTWTDVP